jgi:hypothetical protein
MSRRVVLWMCAACAPALIAAALLLFAGGGPGSDRTSVPVSRAFPAGKADSIHRRARSRAFPAGGCEVSVLAPALGADEVDVLPVAASVERRAGRDDRSLGDQATAGLDQRGQHVTFVGFRVGQVPKRGYALGRGQ